MKHLMPFAARPTPSKQPGVRRRDMHCASLHREPDPGGTAHAERRNAPRPLTKPVPPQTHSSDTPISKRSPDVFSSPPGIGNRFTIADDCSAYPIRKEPDDTRPKNPGQGQGMAWMATSRDNQPCPPEATADCRDRRFASTDS